MASFEGKQALLRLSTLFKNDPKDDDDLGFLGDASGDLEAVVKAIEENVEATHKPCAGEVTLKLKLKGHYTKNNTVRIGVAALSTPKLPPRPARERDLHVDDGVLTTEEPANPLQVEIPGTLRPIDGGKKNDERPARGQKASV